jgi:hypothetical protein
VNKESFAAITGQLFTIQSIEPLREIMSEETHVDYDVHFHALHRLIKHGKKVALAFVPPDRLAQSVGSGQFVDDPKLTQIGWKMIAAIDNEHGLWFIVVVDGKEYILEQFCVHERRFELITIICEMQLSQREETDGNLIVVDVLYRRFSGFVDGLQFRVGTSDFGPFVGLFFVPWCVAADDVDGINLFETMNLGYDVSTWWARADDECSCFLCRSKVTVTLVGMCE